MDGDLKLKNWKSFSRTKSPKSPGIAKTFPKEKSKGEVFSLKFLSLAKKNDETIQKISKGNLTRSQS